jgi:hypothetical protein
MTTNTNGKPDRPRFQFRVRTLLWLVTATCIILGIVQLVLPEDFPIEFEVMLYVYLAALSAYGVWEYRRQHRQLMLPRDTVAVNVDVKWLRRVKSPLIMLPIAALTGVSTTAAPLFLFWCGQVEDGFGIVKWVAVSLCFLIIYIVPGFYMSLAGEVLGQLSKLDSHQNSP